ncbi:protein FAR1-RELATED SEQUENCE 1-like [Aegilops tauschii subsp. strangulata]|uniref:protein FAR1-RELATED SEQUENCE 1-like n=1 Tax=Aegilops tauschii subsp. strangulata TaxID=200361 RepID=UPI001ABD2397|nr:protein FAR1-RELATED SEQUENCE 5-like [Aegilops tauschii subsp. strangulata]
MVPKPPYVGQRFDSFEDAKEFYLTYAKFHGFAVNSEYHRKIKETNEYSRCEMRCYKARRNKKGKGVAHVVPERKRGIIVKTECPVRCKLNVDGARWVVTEYFDEHNHKLIKKFDLVKFLTAHRGFTPLEKKFIKLLHDCNVGPSRMVQLLSLIHSKNGTLSRMPYIPADVTNLKAKYRRESRWHIIKKAEETLGPFFADRPDLHEAFELCVDHSLTVEEFERSWMAMIETYKVQDNETLASLWQKRMYWVLAYFMHCFFPFLQTTQRSEGFNAVLKRYVSPGNSLLQFAKQYTALQQKILGSELQQEANTAPNQPKLLTYLSMERQMSKTYTNKIFNK